MLWRKPTDIDNEFRRIRVEYLLNLPLSDKPLAFCSQSKYAKIIKPPCKEEWLTMTYSPLGGCIAAKDAGEAEQAIDFTWGVATAPEYPLPPGIVAELLFDVGMHDAFTELISSNEIAFDHVIRLEGVIDPHNRIKDAQSFAIASRAKNAAMAVINEINNINTPQYR